jgi:hypothetical protein
MSDTETRTIRLERQPHRNAIGRLREAYQKLHRKGQTGPTGPIQEVTNDPDSSPVCPSVDASAGTGSND